MRFFNTRVEHFDKYIWVIWVFNHELLGLLHRLERVFINVMRIVEEHVILRTQLNPDLLWILVLAQHQDFDLDSF